MTAKEKINLLEVIPCRSGHIKTKQEGETIVLSFPRFKHSWMNYFLMPRGKSRQVSIHLEAHGSAVWNLIDGKRTVQEIIDELAGHFQGEAGYDSRILIYISKLCKDGLIRFIARV